MCTSPPHWCLMVHGALGGSHNLTLSSTSCTNWYDNGRRTWETRGAELKDMPHSLRGVHPLGCQMVSRSLSPLSMETMAKSFSEWRQEADALEGGERKKSYPLFPKSRPLIDPTGCVQSSSSCSVNRYMSKKIIHIEFLIPCLHMAYCF